MSSEIIIIDGGAGEGGGQILRTSLALSLATGRAFRIEGIRKGRSKPGLLRQHLTSLRAAAAVGAAEVEGVGLGSRELTFRPQACLPGAHHVQVGSAGSTCLVVQSILPALLFADGPSEIVVEGGTHAKYAPPFEYLRDVWIPQLNAMGAHVAADIERHGFFPAGGGRIRVRVTPATDPQPLHVLERGARKSVEARAILSRVPAAVGDRELKVVGKMLGWQRKSLRTEEVSGALCAGNVLLLKLEYEHVSEVIMGLGAITVRAEEVAKKACRAARQYMASTAPVSSYLADQLMLPMALGAGGSFRTPPLSRHAQTNLETIAKFLPAAVAVESLGAGTGSERMVEVRIGGRHA